MIGGVLVMVMLSAVDRLADVGGAMLLMVVVEVVTGVSDEVWAEMLLVRVVMALTTVIAWAAVVSFWQVRLIMGLSGRIDGLSGRIDGLSGLSGRIGGRRVTWAAVLLRFSGMLVAVFARAVMLLLGDVVMVRAADGEAS